MTRWQPFAVALALPIAFVAFTLITVALNHRAVTGEVVLTDRDVSLDAGTDQSSGARLWLSWSDPAPGTAWLPCPRAEALGFGCAMDPRSPAAERYYARQLPRYAFVAFALDGSRPTRSRLVPVDASRDPAALRRRYADRSHLIVPAVVGISRMTPLTGDPYVTAVVVNIDPRAIQIPTELRAEVPQSARPGTTPPMSVAIRYGARWEPWVESIEGR